MNIAIATHSRKIGEPFITIFAIVLPLTACIRFNHQSFLTRLADR
ncbi:hypothetical protein [Labrys monachus]|uniref:Uncharacterized protein n=1 Tax=Labrys monachus TaxID=217067 RepID=A0ABU0FEG8_9HYPH|nr:hypothetical protein [Labrys monachus]MDQ0393013.1 hypothetical protein [Labrys monachus]